MSDLAPLLLTPVQADALRKLVRRITPDDPTNYDNGGDNPITIVRCNSQDGDTTFFDGTIVEYDADTDGYSDLGDVWLADLNDILLLTGWHYAAIGYGDRTNDDDDSRPVYLAIMPPRTCKEVVTGLTCTPSLMPTTEVVQVLGTWPTCSDAPSDCCPPPPITSSDASMALSFAELKAPEWLRSADLGHSVDLRGDRKGRSEAAGWVNPDADLGEADDDKTSSEGAE